jgi:hypothetical protein
MKANESKSKSALGFLTVLDYPEYGLFGGYLVLNALGRPLEFHCTAPVRPNRAQHILYGPTLEPYLFGEQIGCALVAAAKTDPRVVFTDREPVLALRQFVEMPVVLVLGDENGPAQSGERAEIDSAKTGPPRGLSQFLWQEATKMGLSPSGAPSPPLRLDPPHAGAGHVAAFQLGRNRLAVPLAAADDRHEVTVRLADLPESFDLAEPFERIREAIEEARRGG